MPDFLPLPEEVLEICSTLEAPPRLVAHLTLVHDVACKLVDGIQASFPTVELDREGILFGAATHDVGKATFTEELAGPGKVHESHGAELLRGLGIPEGRARFARSHGNWVSAPMEDLIVALADNCWKGKRVDELESLVVSQVAFATGKQKWEVFSVLDEIIGKIASEADARLAWQAQFPAI